MNSFCIDPIYKQNYGRKSKLIGCVSITKEHPYITTPKKLAKMCVKQRVQVSVSESHIGLDRVSGMIGAGCVGTTHFSLGTKAMTSTEDQVNLK